MRRREIANPGIGSRAACPAYGTGRRGLRTNTYVRNGTTSLFAALDIATGRWIGQCYKRHRATEFLDFLKRIDADMPKGPDVHLMIDNYASHKTPNIKAGLSPDKRNGGTH